MKHIQRIVLAFAYFQMITAPTSPDPDLKLKSWCAEFGTVKDDDKLQEIALSKFQELRCRFDVVEGMPSTTNPTALFVIELPTARWLENGINTSLPLAVKNATIVVFRLQFERKDKEPLYFFVNLILWEEMDGKQLKVSDWSLTYVSHCNTENVTKVKIRSYSSFKLYNYFKTPWKWTENCEPKYCCTFLVDRLAITYSISGQNKASTGQLNLVVTTVPRSRNVLTVNFQCQADVYEHVCKDIQQRVNGSLLKPPKVPRSDFYKDMPHGYLLTKQSIWKNDSYWFLQYESRNSMFIRAVEVRKVFDEPVICSTWHSSDINLVGMSKLNRDLAAYYQCYAYLNNKNVFLEEIIPEESRKLIQGASLNWNVDEEETVSLIYVLRVEFKNSIQKNGRISNYVAIHVIHDNDQNPVKYHYAVGSINLQGQFQCEYKTQEGIRSIEEIWEQIKYVPTHWI